MLLLAFLLSKHNLNPIFLGKFFMKPLNKKGILKRTFFPEKSSCQTAVPVLAMWGRGNIGGGLRREGIGEDSHREGYVPRGTCKC
jgi:hypothetical protein